MDGKRQIKKSEEYVCRKGVNKIPHAAVTSNAEGPMCNRICEDVESKSRRRIRHSLMFLIINGEEKGVQ